MKASWGVIGLLLAFGGALAIGHTRYDIATYAGLGALGSWLCGVANAVREACAELKESRKVR